MGLKKMRLKRRMTLLTAIAKASADAGKKAAAAAAQSVRKIDVPNISRLIEAPDIPKGQSFVEVDGKMVDADGFQVSADGRRVDADNTPLDRMKTPEGEDIIFVEPEFKGKVPDAADGDGKYFVLDGSSKKVEVDAEGYRLNTEGKRVDASGAEIDAAGYRKATSVDDVRKGAQGVDSVDTRKKERKEVLKKVLKGAAGAAMLAVLGMFLNDTINLEKRDKCKENCQAGDEMIEACGAFYEKDEAGNITEYDMKVSDDTGEEPVIATLDACCEHECDDAYPVYTEKALDGAVGLARGVADTFGLDFGQLGETITYIVLALFIVFILLIAYWVYRWMFPPN